MNNNNKYFISDNNNNNNNNNNTRYASPRAVYPKPSYPQHRYFQPSNNLLPASDQIHLITQLKLSLHKSIQSQSILQSELNTEKSRSYEFLQLNHKLTQQLSKMQFQLDRINTTEKLNIKQLLIKYETVQNQNIKINVKNNQLYDEVKKLRKQNRELTSYSHNIQKQMEISLEDNKCLLEKIKQLENQVIRINNELNQIEQRQKYYYQQQYNQHNHNNKYNKQNNINNQIFNSIITTRTNNIQSHHKTKLPSHHLPNPNSIFRKNLSPSSKHHHELNKLQNFHSQNMNNIDYQVQNSKLIEEYNNLAIQNQSMKKLYKEFYLNNHDNNNKRNNHFRSISQENSQYQAELNSNHNHKSHNKVNNNINQQINRKQVQNQQHQQQQHHYINNNFQQQKLATFQRQQLKSQINQLRQQVITDILTKYYSKTITQSSKNNKNCLVIFIKQITKNLQLLDKMIINYLMARDMYKKQLNVKRLQEGQPQNQLEKQLDAMFEKVKIKLKADLKNTNQNKQKQYFISSQTITLNINAYYLAIFRLLTLISKHSNNLQSEYVNKLKHYCLKYIHKIKEETEKLKNNHHSQENNHGINNFKNKNFKYSLTGNNKN